MKKLSPSFQKDIAAKAVDPAQKPLSPEEWLATLRTHSTPPYDVAAFQKTLYQRPHETSYRLGFIMLSNIFGFLVEKCTPADVTFFCAGHGFLHYLERVHPRGFYQALNAPPSTEHLFAFLDAITDRDLKFEYGAELMKKAVQSFDPALTKDLLKHETATYLLINHLRIWVENWPLHTQNRDILHDILSIAAFEKDPKVIQNQKAAQALKPKTFVIKKK